MISTILIKKEIRQHKFVFLSLFSLYLIVYLLIHYHVFNENDIRTVEQQLQSFLLFFVSLASFIICERLVRKEYGAKTQIFLEGLPLKRFEMIFSKYILGLGLVFILFALITSISIYSSYQQNKMDLRFLSILATRVSVFCLFWYSFFFATSFLGRYRLAFYVIIFFALVTLSNHTVFEIKRFAPMVLMDTTFPFDRVNFPLKEISITVIISAVLTFTAFLLAMVKEGSLAAMVSEKMTHREKVFLFIVVTGVAFSFSYIDAKQEKKIIEIDQDISISDSEIEVNLLLADSTGKGTGEIICKKLHSDIKQLKDWLKLKSTLPVNIVERLDLDPDKYEYGNVGNNDGIVLRTNFMNPEWNKARLFEAVYHRLISSYTKDWVLHERSHWVLDGFSLYWSSRNDSALNKKLWLRSLAGLRDKSIYDQLLLWDTVEKMLGVDVASGVAWSALVILKENFGEEKLRKFVNKVFNPNLPKDFRIFWEGYDYYSDVALESIYNLDIDAFKELWLEKMKEKELLFSKELQKIPHLNLNIALEDLSEKSKIFKYQTTLKGHNSTEDTWVKLKFGKLNNFATSKNERSLKQDVNLYEENRTNELQESFELGSRIYCSAETHIKAIGCYLNSGWQIVEVY